MRVAVINGSPKGQNSITLQTVLYLEKKFQHMKLSVIPAAAGIRGYEKDMTEANRCLEEADLILFSYPVYTFLVPSQLHRFIELMKEECKEGRLKLAGKFVTQISTSKHFYDITAHTFIEENCKDLGMKVIRGLSADMEDLTKQEGRLQAQRFYRFVIWNMKKERSGEWEHPIPVTVEQGTQKERKPIVIVADLSDQDEYLKKMVNLFCNTCCYPTEIVNLQEFTFTGGCLGCLRCASTGTCIYQDGFDRLLREKIQKGAAVMYAFSIRDHSMGSLFKMYDDRQFCNGHRTVTMGSPVGYLISGDYEKEQNLRQVLEARAETGGNFFAGVAQEEGQIRKLQDTMLYALEHHYAPPSNFYGVGGMKIFRDLIYQMRGFMKEDHQFFKEHGQYDFPQKKKGTILLMYLVGAMNSSEKLQKKMGSRMNEGMLAPYKKVIDEDL